MNTEELEQALEASPGERVTADYMHSRIKGAQFLTVPDTTLTLCIISLDNGFNVVGEAACVDPANFNAEVGQKIAYDNAFNKLWPLFGFALAEKRRAQEA